MFDPERRIEYSRQGIGGGYYVYHVGIHHRTGIGQRINPARYFMSVKQDYTYVYETDKFASPRKFPDETSARVWINWMMQLEAENPSVR